MNLTYFKFLFVSTIKRRPVYIMWILYLFLIFVMLIFLPLGSGTAPLFIWTNPFIFGAQSFFILVGALLSGTLAAYIFSVTKDEGSDLVVICKKISKHQMIFTKLLLMWAILTLVNISACLLTCFTFLVPGFEKVHYGWLILSMLVGNIVNLLTFSSIAGILSIFIEKVAIIIANTAIALILFIWQVIAALALPTPLTNLTNKNIGPNSYVYLTRNEDGSYKEDNIVDFVPTATKNVNIGGAKTWSEFEQFWLQNSYAKQSSIISAFDIATQIGSSYIMGSVQDYAQKLATRQFGSSRLFDYNLICAASPEVLDKVLVTEKTVDWIYTGARWMALDYPLYGHFEGYIPAGYGFPALNISDALEEVAQYYKQAPIGVYTNMSNANKKLITLEQDEWNKYKDGFTHMYNTIFRYDLKDIHGNNYYDLTDIREFDYMSAWAMSTANLANYYELVWACLTGNANKYLNETQGTEKLSDLLPETQQYYNINNVDDLNTRFIQFKYFIFHLAQDEQQKTISWKIKPPEKELAARTKTIEGEQAMITKMGLKMSPNTWYMTTKDIGELPHPFMGYNEKTLAYHILIYMLDEKYRVAGESDYDLKTCSYARIKKCSTIYEHCIAFEEPYLYNTLDINQTVKRSPEFTGEIYSVSQVWIPQIAGRYSKYAQNMSLFFYETKQKMPYWGFAIIWILIACAISGGIYFVYKRYDIM